MNIKKWLPSFLAVAPTAQGFSFKTKSSLSPDFALSNLENKFPAKFHTASTTKLLDPTIDDGCWFVSCAEELKGCERFANIEFDFYYSDEAQKIYTIYRNSCLPRNPISINLSNNNFIQLGDVKFYLSNYTVTNQFNKFCNSVVSNSTASASFDLNLNLYNLGSYQKFVIQIKNCTEFPIFLLEGLKNSLLVTKISLDIIVGVFSMTGTIGLIIIILKNYYRNPQRYSISNYANNSVTIAISSNSQPLLAEENISVYISNTNRGEKFLKQSFEMGNNSIVNFLIKELETRAKTNSQTLALQTIKQHISQITCPISLELIPENKAVYIDKNSSKVIQFFNVYNLNNWNKVRRKRINPITNEPYDKKHLISNKKQYQNILDNIFIQLKKFKLENDWGIEV